MRDTLWMLFILVIFGTIKADDSTKTSRGPREVFCADGAALFRMSADRHVTSPPTTTRLRILRLQDGKLLLDMGQQLVYPVVPYVTPVFLSQEDKLIMLPDLEEKGAAIGLQLPEGLLVLVHQLLHQPPPLQNVAKVLSKAESVAAELVHKAEAMDGVIREKAASLQTGDPAAPGSHPWWRAGAHYTREATERVVEVTTRATNLVGKAIEKVGQAIRPPRPDVNIQTKGVEIVGNPKGKNNNKPMKYLGDKLNDNMATATVKAMNKITEALIKAAQIVATSLKENTVKVVQYKFGEDMGEAMGDVIRSVKNTVAVARHVSDLQVENIARRALSQVVGTTHQRHTSPPGTCQQDL